MVGLGPVQTGQGGQEGEERLATGGAQERATCRYCEDEMFGKGEEGQVLESLLLGLRSAVTMGSSEMGEGPL